MSKMFLSKFRFSAVLLCLAAVSVVSYAIASNGCPDYGTQSVTCPSAPAEYNDGPCRIQGVPVFPPTDPPTYTPALRGGAVEDYNIDALQSGVQGSQITDNQSAPCYTVTECSLTTSNYNGESDSQLVILYGASYIFNPSTNAVLYPTSQETTYDYFPHYSSGACPE